MTRRGAWRSPAAMLLAACLWAAPAVAAAEDTHGEAAAAEHGGEGHGDGADHGAHGHGDVGPMDVLSSTAFWATVINFVIFVALVVRFGGRPIGDFFSSRRTEIQAGLAEGKRLKAEAEATKAEYEARMTALDQELASLREEIVRSGEKERDRLKAEAEARAARMRRDAELAIEQRVNQLRHDLTAETMTAALAAAKDLIRDQMTPDDQKRLADGYLTGLEDRVKSVGNGGATS